MISQMTSQNIKVTIKNIKEPLLICSAHKTYEDEYWP